MGKTAARRTDEAVLPDIRWLQGFQVEGFPVFDSSHLGDLELVLLGHHFDSERGAT